jgi:flavin reductase
MNDGKEFMNVSVGEFKAAMRAVPGAVAVITSQDRDERNGMTATAVCSVSADPPQILICVNASASVRVVIERAKHFAVNFLSTGQKQIADLFSQPKLDPALRFGVGDWQSMATGSPTLIGAVSSLDCQVVSETQHGSHLVIVGSVVATQSSDSSPLIYHAGSYCEPVATNRGT